MRRSKFLLALTLLAFVPLRSQQPPASFLILNAQLADGTGAPLRHANVRIFHGRIANLGDLRPQPGESTIDAHNLVLAPGFIDIYNPSADTLPSDPLADSQIAQGITTVVIGSNGHSPWPIVQWVRSLQQAHTSVNFAVFVGYTTIRLQVVGNDDRRSASPDEILQMQQLLGSAMNQQALGLSSGPDEHSDSVNDELAALSKLVSDRHGIFLAGAHPEAENPLHVLALDVREKHRLTLVEAVHELTALPAQRLGFSDRGIISEGAFADLILFHPDTVSDRAASNPASALPTGIEKVFVNGALVWDHDKTTGSRPGFFLGHHGTPVPVLD